MIPLGIDYTSNVKRVDLARLVICTRGSVDLNQLEKDFQKEVQQNLDKENRYDRKLYFIRNVEENLTDFSKYEIKRKLGWENVSAVFIRGTANPDFMGQPKMNTRKILKDGLDKIKEKYEEKLGVNYRYIDELDTGETMKDYGQEILKMEQLN